MNAIEIKLHILIYGFSAVFAAFYIRVEMRWFSIDFFMIDTITNAACELDNVKTWLMSFSRTKKCIFIEPLLTLPPSNKCFKCHLLPWEENKKIVKHKVCWEANSKCNKSFKAGCSTINLNHLKACNKKRPQHRKKYTKKLKINTCFIYGQDNFNCSI